jgi:hypothetical protein
VLDKLLQQAVGGDEAVDVGGTTEVRSDLKLTF